MLFIPSTNAISCIYFYSCYILFFFNATATPEIYTLSLHDALPICERAGADAQSAHADTPQPKGQRIRRAAAASLACHDRAAGRSEEHTSELQSHVNLVCRLLLEKKKKKKKTHQKSIKQLRQHVHTV